MPVYIPSMSRSHRCLTLDELGPEAIRGRPFALVVPPNQFEKYVAMVRRDHAGLVHVLSCKAKGIARTRQWIGQYAAAQGHSSFLMLDDDLRFHIRANPEETAHDKRKLRLTTGAERAQMLRVCEKLLEKYTHIGIRIRAAYHDKRLGYPVEYNVRALRALGYQTAPFNKCIHGRVDIMEDFDITLQLLAKGYPNAVTTHWTQDQSQTQAAGGCSDYRTHAVHQRSVKRMAALWPDVVALREKNNKTGGEFGKRMEATVQWKKTLGLYERQLIGDKP